MVMVPLGPLVKAPLIWGEVSLMTCRAPLLVIVPARLVAPESVNVVVLEMAPEPTATPLRVTGPLMVPVPGTSVPLLISQAWLLDMVTEPVLVNVAGLPDWF